MHIFLLHSCLERYKNHDAYDVSNPTVMAIEKFLAGLEPTEEKAAKVDRNLTKAEKFTLFKILLLSDKSKLAIFAEIFNDAILEIFHKYESTDAELELDQDLFFSFRKNATLHGGIL